MFENLEKRLLRTLWGRQYPDFPFEHTNIRKESWRLMKFKKDEFDESIGPIIYGKGGNLVQKLDRLTAEIISDKINNRKTTIHPIHRLTSKVIDIKNLIKLGIVDVDNILLLVGLEESSRRDTSDAPANTTGVQYIQYGTDGTAESESQTGVIAATGSRFDLDAVGQRSTVSQTSKYGHTADDTDLTVPVTLKEAALYNQVTTGKSHARLQFPDFNLIAGERITIQINELMQNLVI